MPWSGCPAPSRKIRSREYLFSLGTALQHQKRYEEALQVFDKAVQLKPDKAELWTGLGKALVDLGRRAEALLSFQHALKLNPNNWEAAHENGMLLDKLGRRKKRSPVSSGALS